MQKYLWKKSGLVVIGMLYLFLAWKGKRMIMVSGQELVEEPQEARKVALTFDDGPSEYTVELSRGLKERRVQATFFLLGENMEGRRKMVEELVKDGHLIGNHSYHHVQLNKLSIEEATGEIEKTNRLIREWTGEAPVYILTTESIVFCVNMSGQEKLPCISAHRMGHGVRNWKRWWI